jgi:hypothetical protein
MRMCDSDFIASLQGTRAGMGARFVPLMQGKQTTCRSRANWLRGWENFAVVYASVRAQTKRTTSDRVRHRSFCRMTGSNACEYGKRDLCGVS